LRAVHEPPNESRAPHAGATPGAAPEGARAAGDTAAPAGAPRSADTAPASFLRALFLALVGLLIEGTLLALALGGVAPLLGHPPALALLAIWTAGNFALAVMRPVGRQDVARGIADAPLVMAALLLMPLLATPVSALGERLGLAAAPWNAIPASTAAAIVWSGVALSAFGLVIRIAAMRRLGARFSPRIALQRGHALETGGLYARIRHPGYLGALLATLGGVLAFKSMLAWPLFALMWVAQSARARREESLLEEHFGGVYRDYAKRTGRFLPKIVRT
jgi:protein-S-isoprenylcysteine O-methyltransferase Ste14